jgi:quinol monooxygenase YgiN
MSGPLIFVSHSRVKPGKLETYRAHCTAAVELVESEEPQMIGFHLYASENGSEVSTVMVHPDAESLDTHLKLFVERLADGVMDVVDSYEVDVYGKPSDSALQALGTEPGLRIRVLPVHQAGFLRPQPL